MGRSSESYSGTRPQRLLFDSSHCGLLAVLNTLRPPTWDLLGKTTKLQKFRLPAKSEKVFPLRQAWHTGRVSLPLTV